MVLVTLIAFPALGAGIAVAWNVSFPRVPWRVATLLWVFCALYQAPTLFTSRVDVPGNLAFVAYPWKATGRPAVQANTGILFAEIAPWTRTARDVVRTGEVPLWNRASASGTPLLANQQTAIYHPFTLAGLPLSLGKAFTLSACLRLFVVAFFTFVLLRNWNISTPGAVFGAIAYTFCTFHIVWLLFPLGLSTMMLPLCLVGLQELVRDARPASFGILVLGLALAVLGGHPESALWVWIVTALFAVGTCALAERPWSGRARLLGLCASTFVAAMLLTAFFWIPTLRALRETPRFQVVQSTEANPPDHGLSFEWLLPLITPNVFGTPVNGTYTPPRGFHPAVLNDYGEVASSYAGLVTLGLALAAPFMRRNRAVAIAFALMLFSLLTFGEAPGWRELIRVIPLAGISIHQRLRIFWDLGVCIAAAVTVGAFVDGGRRCAAIAGLVAAIAAFAATYALRRPPFLHDAIGLAQMLVPPCSAALVLVTMRWREIFRTVAPLAVFADLAVATYRYNPPAKPDDVFPVTGAIATLQQREKPFRMAAWGWSFLPDTPGYYGIEDIKTTDPVQHARYMRLLKGYLGIDPANYDLLIRDVTQPFFDYLNIKYIYVPPDQALADPRFVEIYRGADGAVLENTRALPRYFLVERFSVEPSFDATVWRSREIRNFRTDALVDRVPGAAAHALKESNGVLRGGSVRVRKYTNNATFLDVSSDGWNLLVSSDVHWPGWRAYWNGTRQPTVVVNGAFLGCFVPPGDGQLTFRYLPQEFMFALGLSGGTFALLMVLAILVRRKRAA
jgi:hypothetical protein